MMKKILLVSMILMLCLSVFAFGETEYVTQNSNQASSGGTAGLYYDLLSLSDKVSYSLSTLTMIDGALCSTFPDSEQFYTPANSNVDEVCYTNTQYRGVAFQMFQYTGATLADGLDYKGERKLSQGQEGCFPVQYGELYNLNWYYCSDTSKTCDQYESTGTCDDPSEGGPYTIRSRTCTQSGNTFTETVTVNYAVDNAPNICSNSNGGDNTPDDSTDVDSGNDPVNDNQAPGANETVVCQGYFQDIAVPSNVQPGQKFSAAAVFVSTANGTCLFSAAMQDKAFDVTFSQVTLSGSACGSAGDPENKYVAEGWRDVIAGDSLELTFQDITARSDADKHELYEFYVSAWDGCAKDGGQAQVENVRPINILSFSDNVSRIISGFSWSQVLIGFGVLLMVLVVLGLAVMWIRK